MKSNELNVIQAELDNAWREYSMLLNYPHTGSTERWYGVYYGLLALIRRLYIDDCITSPMHNHTCTVREWNPSRGMLAISLVESDA